MNVAVFVLLIFISVSLFVGIYILATSRREYVSHSRPWRPIPHAHGYPVPTPPSEYPVPPTPPSGYPVPPTPPSGYPVPPTPPTGHPILSTSSFSIL